MTSTAPIDPWIHRVQIENFRCFARAEWVLTPGINCLIGSGDNGKTTLLTALEFALWPNYYLALGDNDFHKGRFGEDLVISAVIANPPPELRTDAKYLAYLRGFQDGHIEDDPTPSESDPTAIEIELRVGQDLEPKWSAIKPSLPPRAFGAADRATVGVSRVGEDLNKHLRWGRGSALMRLTSDTRDAHDVLRKATRSGRAAAAAELNAAFSSITEQVSESSKRLRGIRSDATLVADTDRDATTRGLGHVSLHTEADVPVSRGGQGTQRVVAIASQLTAANASRVLLLDEVEQGLEPHRVQHLISAIKAHVAERKSSQVILTTHSPRVIRELSSHELTRITLKKDHTLVEKKVPSALQGTIRWSPDALLCPRAIVCEGATEVGLIRGLVTVLQEREPPVYATVEAADAAGKDNVVIRANALAEMGYDTAVLHDLDAEPKGLADLRPAVERFSQEAGKATENQLFDDLTDNGVLLVLKLARSISNLEPHSLAEKLRSRGCSAEQTSELLEGKGPVPDIVRQALGVTAHKDGWFKRVGLGECVLIACYEEIRPSSHLATTLEGLEEWMSRK